MEEKVLSDLEKMNKNREQAAREYLEGKKETLEVFRIIREGITSFEELVDYVVFAIKDAEHGEDQARMANNNIMYSEMIAVRREFNKLMELLAKGGEKVEAEQVEEENAGEAAHREGNDGLEAYN